MPSPAHNHTTIISPTSSARTKMMLGLLSGLQPTPDIPPRRKRDTTAARSIRGTSCDILSAPAKWPAQVWLPDNFGMLEGGAGWRVQVHMCVCVCVSVCVRSACLYARPHSEPSIFFSIFLNSPRTNRWFYVSLLGQYTAIIAYTAYITVRH